MPVDKNPELAAEFSVIIDGIDVGGFQTCAVDDIRYDIVRDRAGNEGRTYHLSEGLHEPSEITLTKVVRPRDSAVVDVFKAWHAAGEDDRRGGNIHSLNKAGEITNTLVFSDAICTSCKPEDFDATSGEPRRWTFKINASEIT